MRQAVISCGWPAHDVDRRIDLALRTGSAL
jgi:hypothetical protein